MNKNLIEKAFEELEMNINSDDSSSYQEKLVEQLKNSESDSANYLTRIFNLFEKYPDAYWGDPGVIVHYIESMDRTVYENELISSIERCPVEHTLWMLNRICNSKKTKDEINIYCNIFQSTAQKKYVNSNVLNSAVDFLNYQKKRIAEMDSVNTNNSINDNILGFLGSIKFKPKK